MTRPTPDEKPPESLLTLQRQFAGHIRDPEGVAAPVGIEDRRMAIYRRLFFGNLNNLMAKNFPVLRRLVDDGDWERLIRAFMRDHQATTPMFTEIGGEFVKFLDSAEDMNLPPYAVELAHWEFLETGVRLHKADVEQAGQALGEDLVDGRPVLNPTLVMAQFNWPVHQIGPKFQPQTPLDQPILLAASRRRNDRIAFLKLNAVTARLLAVLGEDENRTGRVALAAIAAELAIDPDQVLASGRPMMLRLMESELILGARQ